MNLFKFRFGAVVLFAWTALISVGASASVVSGNTQGSVVVEEFFDYQCPHCRTMLENTEKLTQNNSQIKLVTRVVPLLDRSSWTIARAVLAARNQGKYADLHHRLMEQREFITPARLMSLAKSAGLDIAQLGRDMKSKSVAMELNANIRASRGRNVEVIPAIFVYRANNHSAEVRLVGNKSYSELQDSVTNL
jgi:protein-disulfide isomerase